MCLRAIRLPEPLSPPQTFLSEVTSIINLKGQQAMSIAEKISHAAERKAFETILDSMLKKGQTQDIGDLAQ